MTILRDRLEERLSELRKELADGEKMIADLQARQSHIRETLLRISGAVQVLEEMLEAEREAIGGAAPVQPPPEEVPAPPAVSAPAAPAPAAPVPAAAVPPPAPVPPAAPLAPVGVAEAIAVPS